MVYAAWAFVLGWFLLVGYMVYFIKILAKEKKQLMKHLEDVKVEVSTTSQLMELTEQTNDKDDEEDTIFPW